MLEVVIKYYNYSFLVLLLLLYNIFPKKLRPWVLFALSLTFFYLISSFRIIYVIISIVTIYFSALLISKIEKEKLEKISALDKEEKKIVKAKYQTKKKLVLLLCLLINVGMLFTFKYLKFFTLSTNSILSLFNLNKLKVRSFIAPIGISFYTLSCISYLLDVYYGKIESSKNFLKVGLFVTYFPLIMEGPISRFGDVADDLCKGDKITFHNLTFGLQRILWGTFKKMVIADRLNILVETVFDNYLMYNGFTTFIGALAYTIMLYMDFSSAMDIVIGISEIIGVKVKENFHQPFFSKNISEFWTRWHISLGTFFKDYIYYPLSLSKGVKHLTIKLRSIFGNHYGPLLSGSIALLVVWLLNGLWHGAGWTYICFGLYHFILIFLGSLISSVINKMYLKFKINVDAWYIKFIRFIKLVFLIVIGELIFNAKNMTVAFSMIKNIFTKFTINFQELATLKLDFPDYIVLIISLILIFIVSILKEKNVNIREKIANKNVVLRWLIYYLLIFAIIIFGAYGKGYIPLDPIYVDF